jgi:hypothetical protein
VNCPTACQNYSGSGATLVKTSSNWIFTESDASVYTFDTTVTGNSPITGAGKLLSIQRPSGELITINHGVSGAPFQVSSVVSSRGFALKYENGPPYGGKISAINLANHTCDAAITTCDGVDSFITFSQFNVTSGVNGQLYYNVTQVTAPSGENWLFGIDEIPSWADPNNPIDYSTRDGLKYFKSPDGYEMSLVYDQAGRISTLSDNRGTWTYTYPGESLWAAEHGSTDHAINVTDPSGNLYYTGYSAESSAEYVQDALSHRTTLGYTAGGGTVGTGYVNFSKLSSITQPEGNSKTLTFDSRWNVNGVTTSPKTGSVLPATSITASYPTTCLNPVTCNKPSWTKDAKGNQTDYTYDSVHGGVLSEMQPAPISGAPRPLKLTSWVQKYPYYKNPSGALVAGPTAIWVIASMTECQTAAGSNSPVCDTSAPQRVTTYEYGANGTPNNLRVYGIVVTADGTSRRTCYGYDVIGNKIWETKPRAGLTTCS